MEKVKGYDGKEYKVIKGHCKDCCFGDKERKCLVDKFAKAFPDTNCISEFGNNYILKENKKCKIQ